MRLLTRAATELFEHLTADERAELSRLDTPMKIQEYLDATTYSAEPIYRAPLRVVRDRMAHCFDGACFAALMLTRLGCEPRLLDMLPWDDDDHVLAVWKRGPCYGAVAKSNFMGLRYREPVYRSLRELVMSYFEPFFNLAGNRTLRGYTKLVDLRRFDAAHWALDDAVMDRIADALDAAPRVTLFSEAEIAAFTKVDRRQFEAKLAGAVPEGLRKPAHE